jgi:hypothetical protein
MSSRRRGKVRVKIRTIRAIWRYFTHKTESGYSFDRHQQGLRLMHESTPFERNTAEFTLRNDAETLEAAHRLVDLYLIHLREHDTGGNLFFEAHDLPDTKDAIIGAFRVVIATESRHDVRIMMMKAGMTLAQFQENAVAGHRMDPASSGKTDEVQTKRPTDGSGSRRLDALASKARGERLRLARIFGQAMSMAEGRETAAH